MILFFSIILVFAQVIPERVETVDQAVALIDAAQTEILLRTPTLTSQPVADALMRAANVRGISIFIVTEGDKVRNSNSYGPDLSLFMTVGMATAQLKPMLIVDEQFVVEGDVLAGVQTIFSKESFAFDSKERARGRAKEFMTLLEKSVPLELDDSALLELRR